MKMHQRNPSVWYAVPEFILNAVKLIPSAKKVAPVSTRVMFSGEESCTRQQRGNEAAPQ